MKGVHCHKRGLWDIAMARCNEISQCVTAFTENQKAEN